MNISANSVSTKKKLQLDEQNAGDYSPNGHEIMQCLYIDEAEREMPDLTHIHDKKIAKPIENEILNYRPLATKQSPVKLSIILNDDKPVSQPRRLAYSEKVIVDNLVEEWIENGIIQPSVSDYASPIVLVKKRTVGIACALTIDY